MRNFLKNKRASAPMVIALIVTVAALVIGVYILSQFQASIPNITDTTANQTAEDVFSAGWNAFGLAVVIPLVVVAGVILGYLVRGLGGGAR